MVAAPSGVLLKMEVVYANGRGEGFEGTLLIYDHAVQKNPEVGIRRIPAYIPQYTTGCSHAENSSIRPAVLRELSLVTPGDVRV